MLPVATRGILPNKFRDPIIKLCSFFNAISQKVIDPNKLEKLHEDIIITLCLLEMHFPPSFFDMMVHLIVHLVKQIRILGLVFMHQMYPFEWFMGVLKKYVRNWARPEGCIADGIGTEEVIDFYVDYMDLKPIGVPVSRHEGRLQGKRTLGEKTTLVRDRASFTEAHFTVLQHSIVVTPYIEMHKNMLRTKHLKKAEFFIAKEHRDHFGDWLRKHILQMNTDSAQLKALAHGPLMTILTFQGYDINGYTFYTKA